MSSWHVTPRTVRALSWLVICSPIWLYLADVGNFGRLQHNDYYAIVADLVDGDSLSHDPLRWLGLKSNEHRASLPVLVYALNIGLTHGHNLGLTFFSLLLLTVVLVLLVGLLPADFRSPPWTRIAYGFALALFCYTPVAAHNVAMGFSGTIWFFANVLAVAAIAALVRRAEGGRYWILWPVLLFGMAAAFSHSTHLVLWPTLFAGGVFLRLSLRRMALLAAGMAAVAALFVLSYEPLAYHPEANTRDLPSLLRYAASYLGSLFSGDLGMARNLGAFGIAACVLGVGLAVVLTRSSSSSRAELAPWMMIQLYGLGNALMTAVGRSGFGEGQALSSRYASLAALFWIGLLAPPAFLAWRHRPAQPAGRAAVALSLTAVTAGLGAAMYLRGKPLIERHAIRGNRQAVAAMAIVYGIRDDEIVERTVAPWPVHVWNLRDYLQRSGHVPFDRERRLRLGEPVDPALLGDRPPSALEGWVDGVVEVPEGVVRVSGWAFGREAPVEELLVLDAAGSIRGELVHGLFRPDLVSAVDPDAFTAGWEGYALPAPDSAGLSVWVRLAGDQRLYRLPMSSQVERRLAELSSPADQQVEEAPAGPRQEGVEEAVPPHHPARMLDGQKQ